MIRALGFRIVVKPDKVETVTAGGIHVPVDEKLEKTGVQRGIVVSVGPAAWKAYREVDDKGNERNGRPWAIPGDYVLFARHAGKFYFDPFEDEDTNEYLLMNDDDVIAVIEQGPNPQYVNEVQINTPKSYV